MRTDLRFGGSPYRDARWQKVRGQVLTRDDYRCRQCRKTEPEVQTFEVHHTRYSRSWKPWEASLDDLVTLCNVCHQMISDLQFKAADSILRMLCPDRLRTAVASLKSIAAMDTETRRTFKASEIAEFMASRPYRHFANLIELRYADADGRPTLDRRMALIAMKALMDIEEEAGQRAGLLHVPEVPGRHLVEVGHPLVEDLTNRLTWAAADNTALRKENARLQEAVTGLLTGTLRVVRRQGELIAVAERDWGEEHFASVPCPEPGHDDGEAGGGRVDMDGHGK